MQAFNAAAFTASISRRLEHYSSGPNRNSILNGRAYGGRAMQKMHSSKGFVNFKLKLEHDDAP
jgi:hypothetical protein